MKRGAFDYFLPRAVVKSHGDRRVVERLNNTNPRHAARRRRAARRHRRLDRDVDAVPDRQRPILRRRPGLVAQAPRGAQRRRDELFQLIGGGLGDGVDLMNMAASERTASAASRCAATARGPTTTAGRAATRATARRGAALLPPPGTGPRRGTAARPTARYEHRRRQRPGRRRRRPGATL